MTELVRLAKLQEQRKREKRLLYLIMLGLLIYHCVMESIYFPEGDCLGEEILPAKWPESPWRGTLAMLGLVYRYFGKEEDVKMIPSSQLSRGLGNSIPCDAIVECWNHVFKLRNGPGRKCSPWYGTQFTGTAFEQSALCGLCPECNISGSGNGTVCSWSGRYCIRDV